MRFRSLFSKPDMDNITILINFANLLIAQTQPWHHIRAIIFNNDIRFTCQLENELFGTFRPDQSKYCVCPQLEVTAGNPLMILAPLRVISPSGGSILTTSAPKSDNIRPAKGPLILLRNLGPLNRTTVLIVHFPPNRADSSIPSIDL